MMTFRPESLLLFCSFILETRQPASVNSPNKLRSSSPFGYRPLRVHLKHRECWRWRMKDVLNRSNNTFNDSTRYVLHPHKMSPLCILREVFFVESCEFINFLWQSSSFLRGESHSFFCINYFALIYCSSRSLFHTGGSRTVNLTLVFAPVVESRASEMGARVSG